VTSVAPLRERRGTMPSALSHDDMTDVELTWIEKKIDVRRQRQWHRFEVVN
jgi:hypothetical protein